MINGLLKRKYNRILREKAGKEIVIWNIIRTGYEEAKVNGYTLVAEHISGVNFAWEAWFNSEIIGMGDINGDCNTMKMAKNRATYKMRRHIKLSTLKSVDHER